MVKIVTIHRDNTVSVGYYSPRDPQTSCDECLRPIDLRLEEPNGRFVCKFCVGVSE